MELRKKRARAAERGNFIRFGRCPRNDCNGGRWNRGIWGLFLLVALLFAGGYPLLPSVVGVEGGSDEHEDGEDEEEFHGWLQVYIGGRFLGRQRFGEFDLVAEFIFYAEITVSPGFALDLLG